MPRAVTSHRQMATWSLWRTRVLTDLEIETTIVLLPRSQRLGVPKRCRWSASASQCWNCWGVQPES